LCEELGQKAAALVAEKEDLQQVGVIYVGIYYGFESCCSLVLYGNSMTQIKIYLELLLMIFMQMCFSGKDF